jgi:hypothetical protein
VREISLKKTKDNFLNSASSKYLFNKQIQFDDKAIIFKQVENFANADDDCINIHFTTIQGLHSRLNNPKENALTFEDFENRNTANNINQTNSDDIIEFCFAYFQNRKNRLESHSEVTIRELLSEADLQYIKEWITSAINSWLIGKNISNTDGLELVFKNANIGRADGEADLYSPLNNLNIKEYQKKWQVAMSLRNIEPTAVIHINQF